MAPKLKNLSFDGKPIKVNGQFPCTSSRFDVQLTSPSTRAPPA